jgi:hypothetical protein
MDRDRVASVLLSAHQRHSAATVPDGAETALKPQDSAGDQRRWLLRGRWPGARATIGIGFSLAVGPFAFSP